MLIPKKLYKKIVDNVPLLCIDMVVSWRGTILLVKRLNEPLKGKWWPPGGRVHRGELLGDAARRILKEETGLDLGQDVEFAGLYQGFFKKSAASPKGIHTVSVVYRVKLRNDLEQEVKLDKQSSDYTWADELPYEFIRYLGV